MASFPPKGRTLRSKPEKASVSDDLGPAWLWAAQALAKVAADVGEASTPDALLVAAIQKGQLRVFANSLRRVDPNDDWGLDILSRSKVQSLGYAYPGVVGPTNGSYALTPAFWYLSQDLDSDATHWDWQSGEFLVGRAGVDGAEEARVCWEIRNVAFNAFEIEGLIKLHQLNMIKAPASATAPASANLGGRPRESNWDHWTAQLVAHFYESGIDTDADPVETAKLLDDRLAKRGKGRIDPRGAKRTLEAVFQYVRALPGKPRKS